MTASCPLPSACRGEQEKIGCPDSAGNILSVHPGWGSCQGRQYLEQTGGKPGAVVLFAFLLLQRREESIPSPSRNIPLPNFTQQRTTSTAARCNYVDSLFPSFLKGDNSSSVLVEPAGVGTLPCCLGSASLDSPCSLWCRALFTPALCPPTEPSPCGDKFIIKSKADKGAGGAGSGALGMRRSGRSTLPKKLDPLRPELYAGMYICF